MTPRKATIPMSIHTILGSSSRNENSMRASCRCRARDPTGVGSRARAGGVRAGAARNADPGRVGASYQADSTDSRTSPVGVPVTQSTMPLQNTSVPTAEGMESLASK